MASQSYVSSYRTTVLKKIWMAITGLALVGFVFVHMLGNLSFVFGGPEAFNSYSHKLISLGPVLWVVELILLTAFLVHAYNAIAITIGNKQARPGGYEMLKSAGNPSKKTISSTTMIYTGVILLVFTAVHLKTFKYGPHYATEVHGTPMRDLYRLVEELFRNPAYAFGYVAVMILLGFHLRHGFWSAFQSLGANHPRYSNGIYAVGVILGIVLAIGFTIVPLYVFFSN